MMISRTDGPRLLQIGARVTFPVISRSVKPQGQAPYSRHGPLSSGRLKPDVVLPGDGITSTSVGAACSFKQMSLSEKNCQVPPEKRPHSRHKKFQKGFSADVSYPASKET